MKKRLLSCVLTLAMLTGLCVGMMETASATNWTIPTWEREGEPKTGLKIFKEEKFNPNGFNYAGALGLGPMGAYEDFYGLKDASGNVVLPADYLDLTYLGPNRIQARKIEPAYGVIAPDGAVIYPFTASHINVAEIPGSGEPLLIIGEGFDERNTMLSIETGLYDWNGNVIIPKGKYPAIRHIDGNCFVLQDKNELEGLYEYGVGVTIPCQYACIRYRGDGAFMVVNDNMMCGAVDKNGQQLLPMEYEDIMLFRQGCFIVSKFIDPGDRGLVYGHIGGLIESDSTYDALIDGYGKYLIPFEKYEAISIDNDGYVYGGDWTGKYQTTMHGASGGEGKVYNFTYKAKLSDLLAENGGTARPHSSSSTGASEEGMPSTGIEVSTPGGTITIPTTGTNPSEQTPIISNSSSVFTDVKSTDYYADAVQWAVEKKITSGTSKTTFSPNNTCTNAQILAFLYRANGSPEPTISNPFTDVKATDYYYKAALWAAEKGMVSGSTFGANTPCTRAATIEYIWKAAGSPAASYDGKFDDVPASADYAQAVAWALENGVTSGTSKTTFGPDSTCTRGQIVTFLYRAFGK